jgi:hypothetical protein
MIPSAGSITAVYSPENCCNATQTFTASTRLKGSPTNLTTSFQQGGLFFGSNQDNYVKLVVVNAGSGTSDLKIQLYKEENGKGSRACFKTITTE